MDETLPIELDGDTIPLLERSVRRDGTVPIKVIKPGRGSSGIYKAETLMRDAGKFAKGTKMFWDHPTITEANERPEGSLDKLAGVFVSDARWEDNGKDGPGIYADVQPIGKYKEALEELAPHIGVSIRATGRGKYEKVENENVPVIESIDKVHSVDFVTAAGAGGKILQLFEAANTRSDRAAPNDAHLEVTHMDEKEVSQLKETIREQDLQLKSLTDEVGKLTTENTRLRETVTLREARGVVIETLSSQESIPEMTKTRLQESLLTGTIPLKENGDLDTEKFKGLISEAVKKECDYLKGVLGGRVTDMGESGSGKEEDLDFSKQFEALGLSESAAAIASKGRGN